MGNGKSKNVDLYLTLNDQLISELSKKTKLSADEIVKMHKEFLRDCPNGKLDKKRFTKIYKELYPFGDATKFCNICFLAYDKDKSGFIDFIEFINGMSIVSKGNVEDKLKLAFDIYDTNDDGFIEKKEAEAIISSLFQMYGEHSSHSVISKIVNDIMNKFDNDNNGVLSEKEFVEGCLRDEELRKFFLQT